MYQSNKQQVVDTEGEGKNIGIKNNYQIILSSLCILNLIEWRKDIFFHLYIHSSSVHWVLIWAKHSDTRMNERENPCLSGVNGSQSNKETCTMQCQGVGILDIPGLEAKSKDIYLTWGIKERTEHITNNLHKGRTDPGMEKEKEISGEQICSRSEGEDKVD